MSSGDIYINGCVFFVGEQEHSSNIEHAQPEAVLCFAGPLRPSTGETFTVIIRVIVLERERTHGVTWPEDETTVAFARLVLIV